MRPQPHEATPLRNIGVSAHIDAGKTTLSERILFYAGKIHRIGEVRGDVGATMDSHELERERGITIRSAATQVRWGDHAINLIDTPGHVDFTIEVERALSALDGVVLVLCGVAGVQPQTLTIDRQIRRHELPRLVFINKLDRPGADAEAVLADLRARVDPGAVLVNLPRFDDQGRLVGIVDLIDRRLLTFEGERGAIVRGQPLPDELRGPTEGARERLLEALADHSDAIMASLVDGVEVSAEEIIPVLRKATIERQLTPVLCGSAHLEIGVQPLLDAVVRYLPAPAERPRTVVDVATGEALHLDGGAAGPLCAHAFKVDAGSFGQLTYLRILQGRLTRGQRVTNARSGQRIKVGRLVRIHASSMEEIEVAEAGDIVGLFGVECVHGDTFTEGARWSVGALHVPEPVMAYAIRVRDRGALGRLASALGRFTREDPSLRVSRDEESGETLIAGMGELHLDVYLERMRREHDLEVEVGAPVVAYRESIARAVSFDHLHRKQDGGRGQYARVIGALAPTGAGDLGVHFRERLVGASIPREYVSAVGQGLGDALARGPILGAPVVGVTMDLVDGAAHDKDSSALAFRIAARDAVRDALRAAAPYLLEPIMEVELVVPAAAHGATVASLIRRRGRVVGHQALGDEARLEAVVPLAEMFGYAGELRSLTQGQGTFTMSPAGHEEVPAGLVPAIVRRHEGRAA